MPIGSTLSMMLRIEGVAAGSVFRCYHDGDDPDEQFFAHLDIIEVAEEELDFVLLTHENYPWGNVPEEVRKLHKLDAWSFWQMIEANLLRRV